MSTEWASVRFTVVRIVDGQGHVRYTVWDNVDGQAVPHPRGKRRRYTMREAFSIADTLNQHPAFRTTS